MVESAIGSRISARLLRCVTAVTDDPQEINDVNRRKSAPLGRGYREPEIANLTRKRLTISDPILPKLSENKEQEPHSPPPEA